MARDDPELRLPRGIAWLNMLGSVLFMASALASYVLPRSDDVLSTRVAVAGTLLGALCFLIGAMLMFPAWTATATEESRSIAGLSLKPLARPGIRQFRRMK